MGILVAFLYVVEVFIALLLIAIILVQKSKGGGLGTGFGSAMGESLFGSHANKVLTKITIVLATIFVVNTMILDKIGHRGSAPIDFRVEEEASAPAPITGIQQGGPSLPASLPAAGDAPLAGAEPVSSITPAAALAPVAAEAATPAPEVAPVAIPAPEAE